MKEIYIKNLNVKYKSKQIFDNFNIEFEKGKINVVLGESGVGKTTLLNAFADLIDFEGEIVKGNGQVSYIFQQTRLIPNISVYKNLDLILKQSIKSKKERKSKIEKMLDILEIKSEINKLPNQLSGGQAQRVSMARAFLYPSDLLLMDEPFKALDTALKARLLKYLFQLNHDNEKTIIFVTHAIDECLLSADKFFVLDNCPAKVVYKGCIETLQTQRNLSDKSLENIRIQLLKALY